MAIFNELDTGHASDTLEEVEPRVQRELVASLPVERTAELVNEMTPAQAADILAVLPDTDTDAILEKVDPAEAVKIRSLIERHDQHILDFASTRYITFPRETKVSEAIDRFRDAVKHTDVVMYIYVTDAANTLLGVVDIKELLQADLEDTLDGIMTANIVSLAEDDTVAEASRLFARYSFRAIPIVSAANVMKGVIPYRDVMQLKHRLV
jgi:Mg/Co/Ni transporter MgtE